MKIEDMILVSVDDHVVEPPDLFEGHLPAEYLDRAPRVDHQGRRHRRVALRGPGAAEHRAQRGVGPSAGGVRHRTDCVLRHASRLLRHRQARRRHERERRARLDVLSRRSRSSVGSCSPGPQDKDLGLALLRAYNDWHIDEWCGGAPGRFIPLALPVLWDPDLAADEVRRVAAKGCHAVTFSENPEKLGYPSFHSDYWDPFFAACEDEGIVLCLHIGSSSELVITSIEAPINVMITLQPMNIVQAAADVLWSRVLQKFPNLRLALVRGRYRVDPVLPRARRLRVQEPPSVDRAGSRDASE